jgi:hypothetical protein
VAERWLPSAGLEWACPRLYGTLHEPGGSAVWQVYEDLGDNLLDPGVADARDVGGVVELIAEVHARFAAHAVLGECRRHGGELGMGFYTSEVTRAVALLRSIGSRRHGLQPEQRELADRLLGRMERLYAERHERARLLAALGGPPTLLHGDLWTTNVVIVEHADGGEPRLIDWDHAGVGSVSYDLSTFLYRFPPASRPGILGSYREAAARHGRRLPSDADLNVLFETAECARYACCMGEAARYAAARESWAFDELAQIEGWFERLEPVLS